ncbi:12931_t:CDS:2 [Ambispora gerdemannii]|uniref:Inositol-pentakisphosphate 2-kinase n=1 Tax=Ambispora gerdemannii TaxID=144530 RepID=A0A9N8W9B1_9GLOM|nr:12931_t:CDS:2 [Ambispora gerdemannii]
MNNSGGATISPDLVPDELYQPSSWQYKGEGNSNIILTYIGELDNFKLTVLRLRKSEEEKKDALNINNNSGGFSNKQDEQQDNSIQSSSIDPQTFTVFYVRDVIAPLIGTEHTSELALLRVTPTFLQKLSKSISSHRSSNRVNKDIDLKQRYAILSPDYTKFQSNNSSSSKQQESPTNTISIEIKPKWAFIPTSTHIAASNSIKRKTCRFCMHQYYKHKTTTTAVVTDYCPLDLFSLKEDRLRRAIGALISTPVNNFKLFVDGLLVDLAKTNWQLLLKGFFVHEKNGTNTLNEDNDNDNASKITEYLITLLTATILKEHILFSRLKHLQKTLDELDIEGIMKLLSSPTSSSSSYIQQLFAVEPSLEEWRTASLRYLERIEKHTGNGTLQSSNFNDNNGSSNEKPLMDDAEIKQRILEFLFSTTLKDSILKLDYYHDLDMKIVRNFLDYIKKELEETDDNSHSVFLGANKRKCFE